MNFDKKIANMIKANDYILESVALRRTRAVLSYNALVGNKAMPEPSSSVGDVTKSLPASWDLPYSRNTLSVLSVFFFENAHRLHQMICFKMGVSPRSIHLHLGYELIQAFEKVSASHNAVTNSDAKDCFEKNRDAVLATLLSFVPNDIQDMDSVVLEHPSVSEMTVEEDGLRAPGKAYPLHNAHHLRLNGFGDNKEGFNLSDTLETHPSMSFINGAVDSILEGEFPYSFHPLGAINNNLDFFCRHVSIGLNRSVVTHVIASISAGIGHKIKFSAQDVSKLPYLIANVMNRHDAFGMFFCADGLPAKAQSAQGKLEELRQKLEADAKKKKFKMILADDSAYAQTIPHIPLVYSGSRDFQAKTHKAIEGKVANTSFSKNQQNLSGVYSDKRYAEKSYDSNWLRRNVSVILAQTIISNNGDMNHKTLSALMSLATPTRDFGREAVKTAAPIVDAVRESGYTLSTRELSGFLAMVTNAAWIVSETPGQKRGESPHHLIRRLFEVLGACPLFFELMALFFAAGDQTPRKIAVDKLTANLSNMDKDELESLSKTDIAIVAELLLNEELEDSKRNRAHKGVKNDTLLYVHGPLRAHYIALGLIR